MDLAKAADKRYPATGTPYSVSDEEVIGIPRKGRIEKIRTVKKPENWEFVVQSHEARKAGQHLDLRLGDPVMGHGHSWALRHWPKPGEKRLAVLQSTHSIPYFDWEGKIEEGYGAGDVSIKDRAKVTIQRADPAKITFTRGKNELYSLIRTPSRDGKAWLLLNRSEG